MGPRWEIADADALTFALRFYEHALSGLSLGEAVRQARIALSGPDARPLSFAGYVLYGDPRGALPKERIRLPAQAPTRSTPSKDNLPAAPVVLPGTKGPPRRRMLRPFAATAIALGLLFIALVGVVWMRNPVRPDVASPAPAPTAAPVEATAATGVPAPSPAAEGPVRLCVLPFKNISGEAELDFLREGMTEAVMTDFGHDRGIRLIERAQVDLEISELEFSNSRYVDPRTRARIGQIQGAEVVVMGGFQRAGRTVRAHARFVHVETGEILKSVRVDTEVGPRADGALFDLQDALAARVREAVPDVVARLRP